MTNIRTRFRGLITAPRLLIMPGAYDALSARLIEAAGFDAIGAGGYAAIGSMLAEADGGQSNVRDYAEHYARIAGAVEVPVFADADTGFGGPGNVRQMVRAFEAAGVAGILFSDQTFPNRCGYLPGKQVVPVKDMLIRIAAALDARRDPSLVIVARTDVSAIDGLDAAIERCQLFLDAGADFAKPQGVDGIADITRVIGQVKCPHLATQSQAAGAAHRVGRPPMRIGLAGGDARGEMRQQVEHVGFGELEKAGVAAVTLPSVALFAAAEGVRRVLASVKAAGSLTGAGGDLIPLDRYYDVVRLAEQNSREQGFEAAAARILDQRGK